MATKAHIFTDNRGGKHNTAEEATIADLAEVFGRTGHAENIARAVLTNMAEIEAIFAEHHAISCDAKKLALVRKG